MRTLVCLLLSSCIAFNDVCPPDESEVVGETLRSLELEEGAIQSRETAVGNLLADAMLQETPGANVAVVPAAYISRDNPCGTRDFIQRGIVRQSDIDALVPSDDTVVLLQVTSDDLKRAFERSVSQLGATENPGFLQVAGTLFSVDCAQDPQQLKSDGTILFPGARIDPTQLFVGNVPIAPGDTFKLAVPSSLVSGEYGYVDFTRQGTLLLDTGKTTRQVLTDHLRKASPVDPKIEGRILLRDSCR